MNKFINLITSHRNKEITKEVKGRKAKRGINIKEGRKRREDKEKGRKGKGRGRHKGSWEGREEGKG